MCQSLTKLEDSKDASIDVSKDAFKDAQVWPKALVDAAVASAVDAVISKSTEVETVEDPVEPQISKSKSGPIIHSIDSTNELKTILYVIAFLGLLILGFLYTLYDRVSSLEAWLHGRVLVSP